MTSMTLTTQLLDVSDLEITGDGVTIAPISFRLAAGQRLTLLGEAGSGKSLIAQAIMGTLPPGLAAQGSLEIAGVTYPANAPQSRQ